MIFSTTIIMIMAILLFSGLCVISDQIKDIYNLLVEIARLLKRSDQNAR